MRRRLSRSKGDLFGEEDVNPMGGVSNLADAMLVLAVGIMLALIINWHISVNGGTVTQMDEGSMQEVDASEYTPATEDNSSENANSDLEEKGTVYVDRQTGKMYLVEPNDQ